MLHELVTVTGRVLDIGCGEGRVMRSCRERGASPVGIDISADLLDSAKRFGDVVRGRLPSLSMFADSVFDGAVVSLVLEHIEDHRTLFSELARVVRPRGQLGLIVNHPTYTAPGSAPIQDDDEVLWRTGEYLALGHTDEPAGGYMVRFHHRPLGVLLSDASVAGWDLRCVIERGVSEAQIDRSPMLGLQGHIPRLLGCGWVRR